MKLRELLKFDDIAIQCHDNPDADTIASGYAVYRYLVSKGKTPLLFYSGNKEIEKTNMQIMVRELDIPVKYLTCLETIPEIIITVDCMYGESNVRQFDAKNIAVIDHHVCRKKAPELNEIRSSYGSCSSLVRKMLLDEEFDINSDIKISTALYYGLYMDTNMFSEIRHPADKDLRDLTEYDESLIILLRNSNLSTDEMVIVADTLKNCTYIEEYGIAVAVAGQCDPNILGFTGDLLIQINTVGCCIVFTESTAGYKFSIRSCTPNTNAADLARYISDGDGGGHSQKAGGFLNRVIIGGEDPAVFITDKMISFQRDAEILHSGIDIIDTKGMAYFCKRRNILGFVPSCELRKNGSDILIRMLEGDISIKTNDDLYIMVGVAGEAYPIDREVFNKRYAVCDEHLICDFDYFPSVIDKSEKVNIPLSGNLKSCRAKESSVIMARQLTTYTKIITEWDKNVFLNGVPGDYLVIDPNNVKDFYIVKKDVFSKLYDRYEK